MTNESESVTASEYPETSAERYKMTTAEINRALDGHDQLVSNLNKRILEIFTLKNGVFEGSVFGS